MSQKRPIPKLWVALALAGVLLAVVSGSAFAQTSNLIVNGDAESGVGGNGGEVVSVPDWTTSGNFTVVSYDAGGGFPTPSDPGPPDRGANFFAGGEGASSNATQSIDVSSADAAAIDTGNTPFDLSGYLGGFLTDGDNATLSITFKSALGSPLGTASIGPVSAADRGNVTGLLPRSTSGNVPTGTRQIDVLLQMTRTDGASNDGYADNLSLVFTTAPVANDDPTTTGNPNYATNKDVPLTVSLANGVLSNDTDPNGDTLTVKDANPDIPGIQPWDGPSHGTLTLNSDGSFDYTPDAGFSGTDTFTYKANDGTDDSNTATVTITVNDGCTINGTEGGDVLQGTSGGDVICGKGGNDSISGFSGNDRITGGTGADRITGGSGRDRISARDRARDSINCGSGIDTVIADRIDNVSRTCERVSRR